MPDVPGRHAPQEGEGVSQTFTIPEETSTQLQAKQSTVPPSEFMEPITVDEKELKEKGWQR